MQRYMPRHTPMISSNLFIDYITDSLSLGSILLALYYTRGIGRKI